MLHALTKATGLALLGGTDGARGGELCLWPTVKRSCFLPRLYTQYVKGAL